MKLRLLAVGVKMPSWVESGFDEYARRMPPHLALTLEAIKPGDRRRSVAQAMATEQKALQARIKASDWVVALDERGTPWSTKDLATQLDRWQHQGGDVCLLVGGPDGLTPALRQSADQRWSLSKLTFPHPLVRVILAEQLYRAWSLLTSHPYHRE